MSEFIARQAFERMNMREVALACHATASFTSDMHMMARADAEEQKIKFLARREELCEAYGFRGVEQRKPFAFANGIAIIPVTGTLINRFGGSYGFLTGYNFILRQLALALQDDDVKGIVFDINSYGGEAAGCFECADGIFRARGTKPMVAVVDSNCYSAGYAIASACDRIVVTPSGGVGSIGVLAMHINYGKMFAEIGIEVTFITFGEHKADGNPYEALPAPVRKNIQTGVDKSGKAFVALVAKHRKLDASAVEATQAAMYRAEDALALGLIDTIAAPQQAMQVFFEELTGSVQQPEEMEEDAMTTEATQTAAAPAPATTTTAAAPAPVAAAPVASAPAAPSEDQLAAARTAERERMSAIIGCDEAKGKSTLANHLATKTNMSVDEAKLVLAAGAAELQATAPNGFDAAMSAAQHPEVGADASATNADGTAMTAAQRILKDQAATTGIDNKA